VAVLAVEVTWPPNGEGAVSQYEPWSVTTQWDQVIVEKVQGFGGALLPYSPGLLLVAFGVPKTLEQAPQRAVQAALALQHLVAQAPEGEHYPELRMAVHWGQVQVDTGAVDPTVRLLPVGDTLARPVRLLGYAEPGEIVASPEMGCLVRGWCELRTCEQLRGMRDPKQIGAYTIVGLSPQGSPLEMHGQRPLSRFVGRQRELALMEDLLEQAREGRGQVMGIVGEPGVGKSRLCYEFIRAPRRHGWRILQTSTTSYGKAIPYLPVIDLLKAYFQIEAQDAVQTLRDKVTAKLHTLDAALNPSLPTFLSLLDIPVEEPTWQSLDPPQRRQRTLDAVKRLLLCESHVQPLLLVAENLHWVDGETQAFLDTLINSLPTARLLLLVTYRPEYQHAWGGKSYYSQLRLDPLPPKHAQDLLGSLLGKDASLARFTPRLIEQTEGNPFFLEESVRSLVETHVLTGEPGAYRLTKPVQNMQAPTTVHTVLAARIDRLPSEAKRLLQAAAVIGTDVPFPLLQTIAEGSEESVHRDLTTLLASEFLYERNFSPEVAFTFKHALTLEVAYSSLVPERCRVLHARIVEAIEALYVDRLSEQVERLAYHALQGAVWDKALTYCRQAGVKAGTRSAYREAVVYFEQALEVLTHLPESRDTLVQAIDLRLDLRGPLQLLGELGRIPDLLRDAATLAEVQGDQRRLGRILDRLCTISWQMGDYGPALAFGQRAMAISMSLGDVRLQFNANLHLGYTHHALGEYRQATAYLRTNVVSLERALPPRPLGPAGDNTVTSRSRLSLCCAELGAFAEGVTHGEEGVRMAEAADHPFSRASAAGGVGALYLRLGQLHKAIAVLERGVELCQVWQIQLLFPWVASSLGVAYALSGRVAEGLPLLEQAVEQAASMGFIPYVSSGLAALSEGYLLAGRPDDAMPLAQRALDLARQHNERGHQAWVLRLLGEIAMHRAPAEVEPAEDHYRQALALADELGMRPLLAHCHHGLGTLYARVGRREQARAELSDAIGLYRAMDMTFWLPQAEAALAQAVALG
jgi:tetratricopeptide (TPR) repeat protein